MTEISSNTSVTTMNTQGQLHPEAESPSHGNVKGKEMAGFRMRKETKLLLFVL